MVIDLILHY